MMLVTLILVMSWGIRGQDVIIQRHFKGDIHTSGKIIHMGELKPTQISSERRMIHYFFSRTLNLCVGSQFEPF